MKRGLWKKVSVLWLTAIVGLGLAACNGGGGDDNHGGSGGNGGNDSNIDVSDGGKTAQPGKEHVYSFREINLAGRNDNITNMVYQDGKLYLLVYNGGGSGEESSEKSVFGYYKANVDGTDSSFTQLALPERAQTYSWIDNTLISGAGRVYAVENSGYEDSSDPNNYVYEDRYYLNCWDMDGNLQWSEQLDTGSDGEWVYCSRLLDGGEDGVLVIMGGSRNEAVLYSPQGEENSRRAMNNEIFERSSMMYAGDEGRLMVLYYNEEYTKRFLTSYDLENGEAGEPSVLPFSENYSICSGSGRELTLTNEMGLFTWSVGDAEPEMLMSIVNSDLSAYEISLA